MPPMAARTFRRRTTVAGSVFLALCVTIIAVFASWGLSTQGFLAAAAPVCCALPLLAFTYFSFYQPHVIVGDDVLSVQNAMTIYQISYIAIEDFIESRIVLVIALTSGRRIPVSAYTTGSGRKLFGHKKALAALIDAITEKMHEAKVDTGNVQVVRTVLKPNVVISIVTSVIAVVGVVAAVIAA